jgi:HipA-like kinase
MSSVPVRASCDTGVSASNTSQVRALEHIRRMRGGSQAHLMRCSDGQYYVVKFKSNPQHIRVLVNELFGTRLMEKLGLPTIPTAIVQVSQELINLTTELVVQWPRYRSPCASGLQFGSRYYGNIRKGWTLDYLPSDELTTVANFRDFIGMLAFDKWTCNCDGRQFLFTPRRGTLWMAGIDQGFCFNAGEWNFPDSPLRGLYTNKTVYRDIKGMDDFEPWLDRLENKITFEMILEAAADIPAEWYESDYASLSRLLEQLNRRRSMVRELIRDSRARSPESFPQWEDGTRDLGRFRYENYSIT